jgi:hypothetical protein
MRPGPTPFDLEFQAFLDRVAAARALRELDDDKATDE